MNHAYLIKALAAAAICLTVAQDALSSRARVTEVGQRINRAEQNNDRSELPFLEETSHGEDAPAGKRWASDTFGAAFVYLKIANLDESIGFVQRYYSSWEHSGWRGGIYRHFLKKASTEEKDAASETREKLFALLLEIAQTSNDPMDVTSSDIFLLERLPEYATSKQRATLQRYFNSSNELEVAGFTPIKEHFDKIPPKQRIDLRDRFPGLPPPDEPAVTPLPPQDDPSAEPPAKPFLLWLVATIIVVALAVGAVTFRAVRE